MLRRRLLLIALLPLTLFAYEWQEWAYSSYGTFTKTKINDVVHTKGTTYYATNIGIFHKDPSTNTWPLLSNNENQNKILKLKATNSGAFWGITDQSIFKLENDVWTFYKPDDHFASALFTDIELDENDVPWVSTYGGGVYHLQNNKWQQIESQDYLKTLFVNDLLSVKGKGIYVGTTYNGIINIQNGTVTKHTTSEGLPTNQIIRFSNEQNGSFYAASGTSTFLFNTNGTSSTNSISNESAVQFPVMELVIDTSGTLWAVAQNGLYKVENGTWTEENKKEIQFPKQGTGIKLANNQLHYFAYEGHIARLEQNSWESFDIENNFFNGNRTLHINNDRLYIRQSGKFTYLENNKWFQTNCNTNMSWNNIPFTHKDRFFQTSGTVIYEMDSNGCVKDVFMDNVPCNSTISGVKSFENFLYVFSKYGRKIVKINVNTKETSTVYESSNSIYDFDITPTGHVWISKFKETIKINEKNEELETYSNYYARNSVTDPSGNLWITYNSGQVKRIVGENFSEVPNSISTNTIKKVKRIGDLMYLLTYDELIIFNGRKTVHFPYPETFFPEDIEVYKNDIYIISNSSVYKLSGANYDLEWKGLGTNSETNIEVGTPYPNPFTNQVNLQFFLHEPHDMDYAITDLSGKTLFKAYGVANLEQNSITLNTTRLTSGIYFINLHFYNPNTDKHYHFTKKITSLKR